MSSPSWRPGPLEPALHDADVHVWRARLDRPPVPLGELAVLLSEPELERASRLRTARAPFVAGRGMLRIVLGRYLGRDPAAIELETGPEGKPSVTGDALRFSVSHSGSVALYAFARRPVGIDVERLRDPSRAAPVASRVLSEGERATLAALPPERRAAALLELWTLKEAYLKATGEGLSRAPRSVEVEAAPPRLVRVGGDEGEAARWSLCAIRPAGGYLAALAVHGRGWRISRFVLGRPGPAAHAVRVPRRRSRA